jgi:hypothetical protein
MSKAISLLIANISIIVGTFVAVPVQATIQESVISRIDVNQVKQQRSQGGASNSNQYVFSTNSHIDTGISVNSGDTIIITANGTIRFGFFAGSGGPEGIIFNPVYNYFIDLPHGQLMGRIRQFGMEDLEGWFPIGEGREVVVQTPGVLEFAVNDNRSEDNIGSFRVEVTIGSAQDQSNDSTGDRNEVIVYNPRPSQCNHVLKNGTLFEQCHEFRLFRIVQNSIDLDVFSLDFTFQDQTINYAVSSTAINTIERNGKTFGIYPVVGLFRIQPDQQEPQSLLSEGDRKTCAIASDYSELACEYSDSTMLYTR